MHQDKEYAAALLVERLIHDTYPDKQPASMKPLQWSILRYLKSVEDRAVDLSTIARYLGRTNAPISRAVSTLCERGLLTKRNLPGSAAVAISLTKEGVAQLERDPMHSLASWIAELPSSECEVFLKSIRKIAMTANSQGKGSNEDDTGH